MDTHGMDTLLGFDWRITWKPVTSNRLDSTALKKEEHIVQPCGLTLCNRLLREALEVFFKASVQQRLRLLQAREDRSPATAWTARP